MNPLAARLTRHLRPPSIRACLGGGFGPGIALLAFTTRDTLKRLMGVMGLASRIA